MDSEKLKDALDQSTAVNRNLFLSFIAYEVYFFITIASTTDMDLLLEEYVLLPLIGVSIPLFGFCIVAPLFLIAIHFNLIFNMFRHRQKLSIWQQNAGNQTHLILLHPFLLNSLIRSSSELIIYNLLRLIFFLTVYLFPLVILGYAQYKFAKYYSIPITLYHHLTILADFLFLSIFWNGIVADRNLDDKEFKNIFKRFMMQILGLSFIKSLFIWFFKLVLWIYNFLKVPIFNFDNVRNLLSLKNIIAFIKALCINTYLFLLIICALIISVFTCMDKIPGLECTKKEFVLKKPSDIILAEFLRKYDHEEKAEKLAWENYAEGLDFHKRNFQKANFSLSNFTHANLQEANLSGANLSGANFSGANLSKAKLNKADLSGADLSGADLKSADLSKADLIGAKLIEADLNEADSSWLEPNGAKLIEADLSGANLSGANLNGAKLIKADLSGANLSKAKLNEADLSRADLRWANFSGANLSGANLNEADLSKADLIGAKLIGTDLNGANLNEADLSKADLIGANLSGADLNEADSSWLEPNGAKLIEADLSWANLSGADLSGTDLSNAKLNEADLSRTNLSGTDLSKAKLINAKLNEADLSRANLSGTDLSKAKLINANLNEADLSKAKFTYNQIVKVKSVYRIKNLEPIIEKELKKTHPQLFDAPDTKAPLPQS